MNLQENIKKVLKEETNRKVRIHNMIKDLGVTNVIKIVGGFDRFIEKMDINDPIDFLHLFDDLDVVQSKERPDLTLFRYKPKNNIMIYDRKNKTVYINYYEIWLVLEDHFALNYTEMQRFTKKWLDEVYNLRGVTTTKVNWNAAPISWMRSTI